MLVLLLSALLSLSLETFKQYMSGYSIVRKSHVFTAVLFCKILEYKSIINIKV